jgi:uncharacterized protein
MLKFRLATSLMPRQRRLTLRALFVLVTAGAVIGSSFGLSSRAGLHRPVRMMAQSAGKPLSKPTDYVSDFAHVLSPAGIQQLDHICDKLDHSGADTQIAVVTIRSLGGTPIAEYARKLGNSWKVGRNGRGVVVVLAIDDHNWRIEVGRSLERALPNSTAEQIGRDMFPLLRSSDYDGALAQALQQIAKVLSASAKPRPS